MFNKWILITLLLTVVIATFLSPFASSLPDGLEKVAEDKGFIELTITLFTAPIPDYLVPGIDNEALGTGLAGFLGVILTFAIVFSIGKIITVKRS
ncbi:MAG: cobalt/nickel transport protein [Clostridia bacterium]|jgi:cobalt/nickel transport protein|nr:cobalt/nickel transport protein [Clostridia bacterium]